MFPKINKNRVARKRWDQAASCREKKRKGDEKRIVQDLNSVDRRKANTAAEYNTRRGTNQRHETDSGSYRPAAYMNARRGPVMPSIANHTGDMKRSRDDMLETPATTKRSKNNHGASTTLWTMTTVPEDYLRPAAGQVGPPLPLLVALLGCHAHLRSLPRPPPPRGQSSGGAPAMASSCNADHPTTAKIGRAHV